jgi:hypothetical protein
MKTPRALDQRESFSARILGFALTLLAIVLLIGIALLAGQRIVSYDGAMNLQVAQNLVEGEGYTRPYHGVRPFPHEIQTNAPYVLLAAGVIAVGGVNLLTAQLPNLLYLLAFCVIAGGLFKTAGRGWAWPALAALAVLLTPGLLRWGLNGFGEIPALTWWLLGTVLLFRPGAGTWGHAAAAACLGLAVITKTVMLLPVGCTLAVWVLQQLFSDRAGPAEHVRRFTAVALGFLAPVIAFETWRMVGVGGIDAYQSWWAFELGHILDQAGVAHGFEDTEHVGSKFMTHFSLLSAFLDLPAPLAAAWLSLPLALSAWSLRSLQRDTRWLVAAIVLAAVAYFAWWLGVTPTQKAWHRRIFNGMVLVQLLWVYTACWIFRRRGGANSLRWAGPAVLTLVLAHGFALFLGTPNRHAETREFMAKLDLVRSLPPETTFFGQGWHSAPRVQLYSGRPIEDINVVPFSALDDEIIVVRDKEAQDADAMRPLLSAFESMRLATSRHLELHLLDLTRPRALALPSEAPMQDIPEQLLSEDAVPSSSRGLTSDRWASTRVELLLSHPGDPSALELLTFRPKLDYRLGEPMTLRAYANDCALGEQSLAHGGNSTPRFAIPPVCEFPEGAAIRLRLESDNILAVTYLEDPRQLSYILKEIRWVTAP